MCVGYQPVCRHHAGFRRCSTSKSGRASLHFHKPKPPRHDRGRSIETEHIPVPQSLPHRDRNAQDFGLKSQDRAVNSSQNYNGVERKCLALGGVVTNATIDGPAAFWRAAAKRCAPASFKGRREGQNGSSIRVFGARLLRRLHGRTVTDGLFQTKVTAQRSAADENTRHSNRTGQGFRSRQSERADGRRGDGRHS